MFFYVCFELFLVCWCEVVLEGEDLLVVVFVVIGGLVIYLLLDVEVEGVDVGGWDGCYVVFDVDYFVGMY